MSKDEDNIWDIRSQREGGLPCGVYTERSECTRNNGLKTKKFLIVSLFEVLRPRNKFRRKL